MELIFWAIHLIYNRLLFTDGVYTIGVAMHCEYVINIFSYMCMSSFIRGMENRDRLNMNRVIQDFPCYVCVEYLRLVGMPAKLNYNLAMPIARQFRL